MIMRRIAVILLALLLLVPLWAGAEEQTEDRETVTYLNLDGKNLYYNRALAVLAKYPNLKKVDMYDIPVTYRQVEELVSLYPDVEFGWTLKIKEHLVRTDATAFSTLHWSGDPVHSTKEMSVLRYCKQLKALDIGHNLVDDISWLEELPDLRFLIIAINRVSDISPLAKLTKLEYLEMFNNLVTDISPLKGLTHLMDLNIGYNHITDFSPLYEMTWLKRLWMSNAYEKKRDVPEDVVRTLKEKLPDCEIDWQSKPTLGGWRDHPHHDTIKEMFDKKNMHYVPFSDSFPDDGADPE